MSSDEDDAREMAQMRAIAKAQHRSNGRAAATPSANTMEEFYEADQLRGHFPVSFGRQEKSIASVEVVHTLTKRSSSEDETQLNKNLSERLKKVAEANHNLERPSEQSLSTREDGSMVGPPRPEEEEAAAEELIGPPRPSTAALSDEKDDTEPALIGPPRPNDGAGSDSDEEEEEDDDEYHVPLSNEIILGGHTKVVAALAIDPSGSRVLTGSYDYSIRMYDFQGMDSRLQSFRRIEPFEGHQMRAISWSPSADRFLAVTGSARAKIFDRDGLSLGEFIKGDMYIRDLKHTSGHISGLTGGEWHPSEKNTILTSSEDGSLRIWDVTNLKSQKQVIKPKLARPGRVSVTACAWGLEGKTIAGGLADGSIQIWSIKPGWGSRPDIYLSKAHAAGDDVTAIRFSVDGYTMVSRSTDATLKVWDIRKAREPLKVFSGLPCFYAQTNLAFSPDEHLILTGTSVEKGGNAGGQLYFFDKRQLELVRKTGISSSGSVVCCAWHPRLNQIFATTGDKREGNTHVLYDPVLSKRGALVCVGRAPRKKSVDDFEAPPVVRNPHALPMFRDEPSRKRQREKARNDPLKSRRPDLPINGPGHGGRVGATKGSLLTQYLLKEGGAMTENWMEEDPREAILKYAELAAKDPKFIAPAYAQTQPEPVFDTTVSDEEEK
ncbi:WD repeat-containing protein 70 [Selaginella moellendorffii]|nr:WD repeat-containing protein 70 [Selaginella moellendorffii]|eukprot:XP_024530300.1 WD repeat-containing protein 70 [Selaginella moellendorffii]